MSLLVAFAVFDRSGKQIVVDYRLCAILFGKGDWLGSSFSVAQALIFFLYGVYLFIEGISLYHFIDKIILFIILMPGIIHPIYVT